MHRKVKKTKEIAPVYETNPVTENKTEKNGNVYNKTKQNAEYAREWSKENKL
jgi:hypothetical protein